MKVYKRACKQCGIVFATHRACNAFCTELHRTLYKREHRTVRLINCCVCGVSFMPHRAGATRGSCADECHKASRDRATAKHRASDKGRIRQAAYWREYYQRNRARLDQKTRARQAFIAGANAVEPVDPFKVFDRDGWRCQCCGCHTPRRLRGTYEGNAPELDHIVPLAAGGDHSYANTQLLCKSCNLAKGAGSMHDQTRLDYGSQKET